MSDQRRSGAVISLEEIFRSRDFGRRPARAAGVAVATVEPTDPTHLEEVFLSELFGRPEAIAAARGPSLATSSSPAVGRPTLVLLPGGKDAGRDLTRYRGAIGAVSGVAAAALVVAGMTSGTGSPSGQPTISAEGTHPSHNSAPGSGSRLPGPGGVVTPPNTSAPAAGQPSEAAGGSAAGAPFAQFTAGTAPAPVAVVVAAPTPAPIQVVPSPPAPGEGTPPSGTSPGGGGGVLTPVLVTAGNTVSTLGATVTAASSDVAQAVPATTPVAGLLGNVGATVTGLGRSVAGA